MTKFEVVFFDISPPLTDEYLDGNRKLFAFSVHIWYVVCKRYGDG